MVIHTMKLDPEPFAQIREGWKTIELRLYDEKRRKLQIGDTILFENRRSAEILNTRVTGLWVFDSFAALYEKLPLLECGYTEETVAAAGPEDMDAYYSPEDQRKYGVVGIGLAPKPVWIAKATEKPWEIAALAGRMWDHPVAELTEEFSELLARSDAAVFTARQGAELLGFAQCQLRQDYVEGTETSPVGYLEGIFTQEGCRKQGIAASLLRACEAWARSRGCMSILVMPGIL